MAYLKEDIKISNSIFYYLLKYGELKENAGDLYKSYCEKEL